MPKRQIQPLAAGYTSDVDRAEEGGWCDSLREFDDSNIYQTWSYGEIVHGKRKTSRLVLKKDGEVVALAQARIVKLALLNIGIAYIRWGPVWRRRSTVVDMDIFRQAIRALRNEYACKRGLVLRLFPAISNADSACYQAILKEEGFSSLSTVPPGRTILMDISPSLAELRDGLMPHWKRELKAAERNRLDIIEGEHDELFEAFVGIYKEMVSRKQFVEPNDIHQFRAIQKLLPPDLKMKVMLCKEGDTICSGLICSVIGNTALYLFGATSNRGMKSRGSYILQWKLIEQLTRKQVPIYNLNGINPVKNPGTYKFKADLAGRHAKDVLYLGRFDSNGSVLSISCVKWGETLNVAISRARGLFRTLGDFGRQRKLAS